MKYYCLVIVDIEVEIKLSNKTFKKELQNKSSPAYKELEQDVYVEVTFRMFSRYKKHFILL